jgi:hypothetical protein
VELVGVNNGVARDDVKDFLPVRLDSVSINRLRSVPGGLGGASWSVPDPIKPQFDSVGKGLMIYSKLRNFAEFRRI